jgi:hypothetical protein
MTAPTQTVSVALLRAVSVQAKSSIAVRECKMHRTRILDRLCLPANGERRSRYRLASRPALLEVDSSSHPCLQPAFPRQR